MLVAGTGMALIFGGLIFTLNECVEKERFDKKYPQASSPDRRLDDTSSASTTNIIAVVHGDANAGADVIKVIVDYINANAEEVSALFSGIQSVEATDMTAATDAAAPNVLSSGAKSLTPTNAVVASAAVSMAVAIQGAMGAMGMGN